MRHLLLAPAHISLCLCHLTTTWRLLPKYWPKTYAMWKCKLTKSRNLKKNSHFLFTVRRCNIVPAVHVVAHGESLSRDHCSLQSIYMQHGNVFYVKFWTNISLFLSHNARCSQSVGVSGAHQTRISSLFCDGEHPHHGQSFKGFRLQHYAHW